MRALALLVLLASTASLRAQAPAPAVSDALAPLDFLLGSWVAKTDAPAGSAGASVAGVYTFRRELSGHVLSRTATPDSCKGPRDFDCRHTDQLTVFPDASGPGSPSALAALYLDNEGHVIHYAISFPDPHTAVFLSQGPAQAPTFRLLYHLEGSGPTAVMHSSFGMAAPGTAEFHSYLEWSGTRS